jgi:hypothetical protein
MGKKCPPQAFVVIPRENFSSWGRDDELKTDGKFPVTIPSYITVIPMVRQA